MLTTSHPNLPFLQANDLNHATDHRTQANSRNLVPGGRDPRSGESANACAGTRAKEPRVAPFHRAQNETRSPRLLIFTPRFPLFFSRPRVHAHVRAFLPSRQAYRRPIYRSPAGRRDVIFDSIAEETDSSRLNICNTGIHPVSPASRSIMRYHVGGQRHGRARVLDNCPLDNRMRESTAPLGWAQQSRPADICGYLRNI